MDIRLGGPQNQSGHSVEEKNSQPLPGIEPQSSDSPAGRITKSSARIGG
jgi:hypothetical protein